jgi:hypothetical protein
MSACQSGLSGTGTLGVRLIIDAEGMAALRRAVV